MTDEVKLVGPEGEQTPPPADPPAAAAETPPPAPPAPAAKATAKPAAKKGRKRNRKAKKAVSAAASDKAVAKAKGFAGRAAAHLGRKASEDARADYQRALDGLVKKSSQLPDDKPLQLRFADGTAFLDGFIAVERDALNGDKGGGQATYARPVTFDQRQEAADVTEAWLIGGKSAVRVRLITALPVGGGRQAAIPANHLRF